MRDLAFLNSASWNTSLKMPSAFVAAFFIYIYTGFIRRTLYYSAYVASSMCLGQRCTFLYFLARAPNIAVACLRAPALRYARYADSRLSFVPTNCFFVFRLSGFYLACRSRILLHSKGSGPDFCSGRVFLFIAAVSFIYLRGTYRDLDRGK